ncbi:30S ribosomal protein S19e [Bacteroidota bacterium]
MLFNVQQEELIKKTAEELKKLIHMPSWAPFVKTGTHKDRPPVDADWWYVRAAAVLRTIYLVGPVGVSKLRVKYGGKKNRGMKPEKFTKGSGSVIRKVLQQLEEAKLIKQAKIKKHKGRVITPKGKSVLFSAAKAMGGSIPKKAPAPKVEAKAPEVKKETKPSEEKKDTPKSDAKKDDHVVPKEKQLMKEPKEIKKEHAEEKPSKVQTNLEQPKEAPKEKKEDK